MKRQVRIAFAAALAAAGIAITAPASVYAAEPVPEGVYVGEVSLAGLTEAKAMERIGEYADEMLGRTITLTVNGTEAQAGAEALGLKWENRAEAEAELKKAEPSGNLIRRYMKKKDLQENPLKIRLDMSVDQDRIAAFVSESCGTSVTEPQNASLKREDGKFVVVPEVKGTTVDIEATEQAINEAVNSGGTGNIEVKAAVTEKDPEITAEDLSTVTDVLGTFSTDFSSSGASRATNLQVGASKIDGHILMPGETLSGYECMQPFTTANGYRTAVAYENGRSVDSIGGGVCQISTTLYNASLFAELEIVQRFNHSMTVAYVKPSMDAAIAGTYKDLKIKNPYDTPIYIEGYTSGRKLTFTIYGKETRPSNRTLKFESETLRRMDAGAPIEQVDLTLAPGQRVQVQSGHNGLQSRLFKCVYVDGELKERTLLHNDTYNASKAIFRVGPAVPLPEESLPAVPAETQPSPEAAPAPAAPAETTPPSAPAGYEYGPGMPAPAETPAPAPAETPAPASAPAPVETPAPASAAPAGTQPAPTPAPAGPGASPVGSGTLGPGATDGPGA